MLPATEWYIQEEELFATWTSTRIDARRRVCAAVVPYIPNFRRQPGNRSRLKCVYGFIMELVSFSSIIFKTNYDIITVQTAFDSALSDKCSHVLFIYFC